VNVCLLGRLRGEGCEEGGKSVGTDTLIGIVTPTARKSLVSINHTH